MEKSKIQFLERFVEAYGKSSIYRKVKGRGHHEKKTRNCDEKPSVFEIRTVYDMK